MSTGINISNFKSFQRDLEGSLKRLPKVAGAAAVTFFKGSFRRQGWIENGRVITWQKRAPRAKRNRGRAILIDTGRLRRSIVVLDQSRDHVRVGSTVDYAEAHNEGAEIRGSVRVPGFLRKGGRVRGHKRGGRRIRAHKRASARVGGHSRNMNLKIPQRKFIGHSPDVMKSVERAFMRDLENSIGKYLNR